jgi:uncharacterized protein YtpQ (UPF0354 family)
MQNQKQVKIKLQPITEKEKRPDPFWKKLIHYVHKNKKKYNRKTKHTKSNI